MTIPEEVFAWHIKQATYHVNVALHTYFSNERVPLSPALKKLLEGVQTDLETLDSP